MSHLGTRQSQHRLLEMRHRQRRRLIVRSCIAAVAVGLIWEAAAIWTVMVLRPAYPGRLPYEGTGLLWMLAGSPFMGAAFFWPVFAQRNRWVQVVGVVAMAWILGVMFGTEVKTLSSPLLELALHSTPGAVLGILVGGGVGIMGYLVLAMDFDDLANSWYWTDVDTDEAEEVKPRRRLGTKKPDTLPDMLVLRPSLWTRVLALLFSVGFTLLGLYYSERVGIIAWLFSGICASFVAFFFWLILRDLKSPDKDGLTLTREGFAERFGRSESFYCWDQVRGIRAQYGDREGFTTAVVFDLVGNISEGSGKRNNKGETKSVQLSDNYGMKAEKLVAIMRRWRSRALAGAEVKE